MYNEKSFKNYIVFGSIFLKRSIFNRIVYGKDAPKFGERIWINPKEVIGAQHLGTYCCSGKVIKHWKGTYKPLDFKKQYKHWIEGSPWEKTGAYNFVEEMISKGKKQDGCENKEDIIERFKKLDKIFEIVKKEGRLRPKDELNDKTFREIGGIMIHIDPDGKLIFGLQGVHRFAMAIILNFQLIPAVVGCVDKNAISHLKKYRKEDRKNEIEENR